MTGRVAYLFGGRAGSRVFGDLWAYDLVADRWRELAPAGRGPDPRFGHEAVWLDGIGLVVVAGQAGPNAFFGDVWAYDPAADRWRALAGGGAAPVPRYGTCSGVGPDGRLWISHGFTEDRTRFADTRAYDVRAERWSDETPDGRVPVERCLHACTWTPDGRFVLFGGQTTGVTALGDLWVLEGAGSAAAAWREVDGELPDARNLYAAASTGRSFLVFGGRGRETFLDDLWAIDLGSLAARPIDPAGASPAARSGATLIVEPASDRLLLFGGRDGSGALDDLWVARPG